MNIDRKTKDEKEDSWQHHITDSDLSLKLFTVNQYISDEQGNNQFNQNSVSHQFLQYVDDKRFIQ